MIPMTAGFGGPDEGLLRQHKAFSYDGQFQGQGLAGAFRKNAQLLWQAESPEGDGLRMNGESEDVNSSNREVSCFGNLAGNLAYWGVPPLWA
jgi:hypothetical protein